MDMRLSLLTLGVKDVARARAFYERLGFVAAPASNENITFFQMNGMALSLYQRASLAEDADQTERETGFAAITLGHNLPSEAAVDALFSRMVEAGATPLKSPQKVFWGGYSSYLTDLDGHIWELAYNPCFPLDAAGNLSLGA